MPDGDRRSRRGSGRRRPPSIVKRVVAIVVSLAAALGIAYIVLVNMDVFLIETIEVEGTSRISGEVLTEMADVSEGTNLLNVDTGAVASRISSNPWVKSVSVGRSFPHTLVLKIEENTPCALVQIDPSTSIGATQYWLISSDGVWMSQVSSTGVEEARQLVVDGDDTSSDDSDTTEDTTTDEATTEDTTDEETVTDDGEETTTDGGAADDSDTTDDDSSSEEPSVCSDVYMTVAELSTVPFVSGVATGVTPVAGEQETDEGVLNALSILTESDEEFREQISSITAGTDNTTSVMLTSGVEIAFGSSDDMQSKIRVAKAILEEHAGEISYINVRVVSRPSWRGI